ncbi:MAG: SGNH/GDSL hydrolase family protein [Rhodoferax sp.]
MNWIKWLTRIQIAALGAIIFLQLSLLASLLPTILEGTNKNSIILVEICVAFLLLAAIKGRYVSTATTIYLLLALNFITTPLGLAKPKLITLPKNLNTEIRIVGEVMPGFSGVSRVSTDHEGFRVSKPINYKQKKAIRVFAIGGSTTEQIFLDDSKTWTALLQNQLQASLGRDVEVINAGFSGPRAEQHYYTFRQIRQYSPDVVLFLMGINDWNRHIKERALLPEWLPDLTSIDFRESLLFIGLKSLRERKNSQAPAATPTPTLRIEDGSYYSAQNDSLSRPIVRRFQPKNVSENYQLWLEKIAVLCRGSNIKCMFINQPVAYQDRISQELKSRLWMTPPNESYTLPLEDLHSIANLYNKWLLDFSRKNSIESCNLSDKISPTTDYFYDDCHYNERGASRVATEIAQCFLRSNQLSMLTNPP